MSGLAYNRMSHTEISAHEKMSLFSIVIEMRDKNLPEKFIAEAIQTGLEFEGVADLIKILAEEDDSKERDEIVADIQDLIIDCGQTEKIESPYINFEDLEAVAQNIRAFKNSLLEIINSHGGITKLSKETGMPQPSLSRLLNSSSMPHKEFLLKIAKASNLSAVQISTPWAK